MRIFLDVNVAIAAFQAAMDAVRERLPIDGDAVPSSVLQALVAVARKAIRLGMQSARTHRQQQYGNSGCQYSLANKRIHPARSPAWQQYD
jgi:hypothetical protein